MLYFGGVSAHVPDENESATLLGSAAINTGYRFLAGFYSMQQQI